MDDGIGKTWERGELEQDRHRSQLEYQATTTAREYIREANRLIAEGTDKCYRSLGLVVLGYGDEEGLFLTLQNHPDVGEVSDYRDLTGVDWGDLSRVLEDGDKYLRDVVEGSIPKPGLYNTPKEIARERIRNAFRSLEAIAEAEDLVESEYTNAVEAHGYSTQVATLMKVPDFITDDEMRIVADPDSKEYMKTIFVGKTTSGKSASLDGEVEDRYNAGRKIIDIVDTDELENGFYDIPQNEDALIKARKKAGVPPSFEDSSELKNPEMEILVPLTHGIEGEKMPFNTSEDEFTVTPFTIPASSLSKRLLVAFLSADASPQQETALRQAYDDVNRDFDDWCLRDMAERVAERDDLDERFRKRVIKLLEQLQESGFIRTQKCEYALDWERIFRDNDTITSFSVSKMQERADKLMVLGYITDCLYQKRKKYSGLPDCVGVFRELHEIAPHSHESSSDESEKAAQEAIVNSLSYIMRKNGHENLEIIADTQDINDLKKGVRKRFSRSVVFLSPAEVYEEVFEQVAGSKKIRNKISSYPTGVGEGVVVGHTEMMERHGKMFQTPVQYHGASFAHCDRDAEMYDDGWEGRAELIDEEELREHDWDTEVPDELEIRHALIQETDEDEDVDLSKMDNDVVQFMRECTEFAEDEYELKSEVRKAYARYADKHGLEEIDPSDRGDMNLFGGSVSKFCELRDEELETTQRENKQTAYAGLSFTQKGRKLLKQFEQSQQKQE